MENNCLVTYHTSIKLTGKDHEEGQQDMVGRRNGMGMTELESDVNEHEWMNMNLLGYTYKIFNSGYNTEMGNK